MNILLATQNKHKIKEITAILHSISSVKLQVPVESADIIENQTSYIENALIKAKYWATLYPNHFILADDSGLEVEALDSSPGVISAEYAGKKCSHQQNIDLLLYKLQNISNRNACFVSYIVLLSPDQHIFFSRGECIGKIALTQSGSEGFGYDPVFLPIHYQYQKTMAELSDLEKNKISHRYKALLGLKDYLKFYEANHE